MTQYDMMQNLYDKLSTRFKSISVSMIPYFRRFIRFLALPYCYFMLVNWEECTASRYHVIKDFIYIFFVLKYFPDNYSLCRLWEKDRSEWRYYYGSFYDPYQRGRLRKEVQKKEYEILFEDKYVCYQLCKAANLPLPVQYACVNPEDNYKLKIRSILNNNSNKKIIIKPVMGKGGKEIVLALKDDGEFIIQTKNKKILLNNFILRSRSVIQDFIIQHNRLSRIFPSINTIRIVTLLTKNKDVIIIGALMRFGVKDAFIDNTSIGGVAIGINLEEGVLNKIAYDFKSMKYYSHPTSGFVFENFQIPYWQEVVDLSKKIQLTFSYYKLLGHDIAITPDGPIIIEINAVHDNVGIEQSYGPILSNERLRNEFMEYGLLINKISNG